MLYEFTKMQGSGNDFIILDNINQSIQITPMIIRALADRNFGIGADQVLLVDRSTVPGADFRYRIFNANGNEVEHCGNGARCFARFVRKNLSHRNPLRVQTSNRILTLEEMQNDQVKVEMGRVDFDPINIPFDTRGLVPKKQGDSLLWTLELNHKSTPMHVKGLSVVSLSNPHVVQIVSNIDAAPVSILGPLLETNTRFQKGVNVSFVQVLSKNSIRIRVHERDVGETLSCGTGACASVAVGISRGILRSPVQVQARGGQLKINWDKNKIYATGPAVFVFTGQVVIEDLVSSLRTFL